MGEIKQIHIKNRTYYFYSDIINVKNFDAELLRLTKNHTKTLVFTKLGILERKKIDKCNNIHSVNPLHLLIDHANGYIEEKCVNKYLVFNSMYKKMGY